MQAIKSALNQTLARDFYDIIVIKNFADAKIDAFCNRNDIRTILTKKPMTIGQYLHLGTVESDGEVVTFLEDDDLFRKTKLKIVYNLFSDNKDLVYYHNSFEILNYNGAILNTPKPNRPIYVNGTRNLYKLFPMLMSVEALNVNSAISIRKRFLKVDIRCLRDNKIRWMFDSFLFFLAAKTNKLMIIDSRDLTFYRRHKLKTKTEKSNLSKEELLEYFKKDIVYGEVLLLNDIRQIGRVVHDSECVKCLDYLALERKLRLYLADQGKTARMSKKEYLLYLNYILRSKHRLKKIGFLSVHLASKLMPDPVLRFYYQRAISQLS